MTGFVHDIRYAVRSLRGRPGLTAAAIATLALGIGANVSIFSVLNALMWRPLPAREPASLAVLTWSSRSWPKIVRDMEGSSHKDDATGETWSTSFPYPVYDLFRSQSRSLSGWFAVCANDLAANVQIGGRGASADTKFVSGSFFGVLGTVAERGRLLLPEDDRPGQPPIAVASHRFWQIELGGNPDAVNRPISINGRSVILVGVLPPRFFGLEPGASPDLWMPIRTMQSVFPGWDEEDSRPFEDHGTWWIEIGGALRPGVSLATLQTESRLLFDRFLPAPSAKADPDRPILSVRSIAHGETWMRRAKPILILLGLAALVLAVACTNVAGLLLAKASARTREMAIRRSLGANTARLVRQLLVESLVLGLAASAGAFLFADALNSAILGLLARTRHPLLIASPLDGRALLFGLAVAALTGTVAGLMPAWRVSHAELTPSLKETTPLSKKGSRRRGATANLLVSAQVALGLVLVVAAGLFVRTLANLRRVDLGFDPEHVLLFSIRPGLNGYRGERLAGFYDELRHRLEGIPGVRSATLTLHGTIGGGASTTTVVDPTSNGSKNADVYVHVVGPSYFETLGIPIVAGRSLDERDRFPDAPTVVVNRELARTLFPGVNPVGRTLSSGPKRPPFTIVGVSGNVKYNQLRDAAPATFYATYRDRPTSPDEMVFYVRALGDPGQFAAAIRERVASLDPNLPVVDVQTQDEAIERSLSVERIFAMLTGTFGALALVLAAMGLYAALAFAVTRRTREIGVRIALGARASQIRGMVLREALLQTTLGVAVGLVVAMALTRLLKSQLFGLGSIEAGSLALSTGILFGTAALAAYFPARRASSVDPMTALRNE